jgi:hypothetical protein
MVVIGIAAKDHPRCVDIDVSSQVEFISVLIRVASVDSNDVSNPKNVG